MAAVKDFEELAIFQKARELSAMIYPVTKRGEFKYDTRFVQQILHKGVKIKLYHWCEVQALNS